MVYECNAIFISEVLVSFCHNYNPESMTIGHLICLRLLKPYFLITETTVSHYRTLSP